MIYLFSLSISFLFIHLIASVLWFSLRFRHLFIAPLYTVIRYILQRYTLSTLCSLYSWALTGEMIWCRSSQTSGYDPKWGRNAYHMGLKTYHGISRFAEVPQTPGGVKCPSRDYETVMSKSVLYCFLMTENNM